MKPNKLINAFQNFNYVKYLNSTFKILLIFFISNASFGQSDGIEFEFDCNGTIVTVEFEQPDISGDYYVYPEGTAFDSGGTPIQMNWFVVFEQTLNQWELKGPTTQDGSGSPVAFFKNITTASFPSNEIINWIDTNAGGGFSCALTNIIYTAPSGDPDNDGDGFNASVDCNDNDPDINPNATEICDGIDNNCDGNIDEGLTFTTYYADADGDGFGSELDSGEDFCSDPGQGYSLIKNDCDDYENTVYYNAPEICDGLDNNCNGLIDEGIEDCTDGVIIAYCNDAKTKVKVCHNDKVICVSINAVDAHLAHGDSYGSCDTNTRSSNQDNAEAVDLTDTNLTTFNVSSWPNPTTNLFNINIKTPNLNDQVHLQAFDINGRLIYTDNINRNVDYTFGETLGSGMYFIKITQANTTQVIKVVKH